MIFLFFVILNQKYLNLFPVCALVCILLFLPFIINISFYFLDTKVSTNILSGTNVIQISGRMKGEKNVLELNESMDRKHTVKSWTV